MPAPRHADRLGGAVAARWCSARSPAIAMVFLIAPTHDRAAHVVDRLAVAAVPAARAVAALVLRAARRRSDAARRLEQPGRRVLDHGASRSCSAPRRRSPSRAAARRGCSACDLLFMSPLLLPALAFGFAALVFINKLGFSPSIPLSGARPRHRLRAVRAAHHASPRCRSSIRRCSTPRTASAAAGG